MPAVKLPTIACTRLLRARRKRPCSNDWSSRFPLIVEAVNHLRVRSCLIDGEPEAFLSKAVQVVWLFRRRPFCQIEKDAPIFTSISSGYLLMAFT